MPIQRIFFDWSRPALPATADYLLQQFAQREMADLSGVDVIVPGGYARRRLEEILVHRAEQSQRSLLPPRIVTPRELPELLYQPQRPFADELTQGIVWVRALRMLPRTQLQRVVQTPPADRDHAGWWAIGEMVSQLHLELAADRWDFRKVADQLSDMGAVREAARWHVLAAVQKSYLDMLLDFGLWDRQTARLFALDHQATDHEIHTHREIILVGLVDLNRTQRDMLDVVAERVTALVFAPQDRRDWFDEHGCVIAERWQDARLDGLAGRIDVVTGPGEQAVAVLRTLDRFNGKYAAEEVTVAVPDERVLPYVRQRFAECGLPVGELQGRSVLRTPLGRLLRALAVHVERPNFRSFANLVRHPDVERWLRTQGISGDWLSELDDYYNQRLPLRLGRELLHGTGRSRRDGGKSDHEPTELERAFAAVARWLDPLRGAERGLNAWANVIRQCLLEVYGHRKYDRSDPTDQQTIDVFRKFEDVVEASRTLPGPLALPIGGTEALRSVVRQLERKEIAAPPVPGAVELLGWLDLRMDDAPVAIVTGMNEGIVPDSRNADVFLPNDLRRRLGIEDNDRRYARDAYALAVLSASKSELRLIAGRRTAEQDPLVPSRLLFTCNDDELAGRVRELFRTPTESVSEVVLNGSPRPGPKSQFVVPLPVRLPKPVVSMRVTEFADYLQCPYRYYLKQRLRLSARETTALELPPNAFGDLIHDVLEEFGGDPVRHSKNAAELFDFLSGKLDEMAQTTFGEYPLPAVRVQVEQARERLRAFADWQARWRKDGWQLFVAEQKIDNERAFLEVDGSPMWLRGRIDRVDLREGPHGVEVVILDYKTGDRGISPNDKHRNKDGNWLDLQLPLYRHLVKGVDGVPTTSMLGTGYILLPRDLAKTGEELADWTAEELDAADEQARKVVRGVRQENFWPPTPTVEYYREFAAICQDNLYNSLADDDEPAD